MIYFFPMPYPDESLYSIFLRYDKLTENNSYYITISELLGNKKLSMNFSFPNNLAHLCKELPKETVYTPEYFIQNHTVLPIYKPFIPENRYMYAIKNFVNGSTKSAIPAIVSSKFSLHNLYTFKYCPSCITDDKKIYGEAYLHRLHQIDGILICKKHKCMLNVYNAPKKATFYDINALNLQKQVIVHSNKIYEELCKLNDDIEFIIKSFTYLPNYNIVQNKYYSKLFDKDYVNINGNIKQKSLYDDFTNYYSNNLLDILNSKISIDNSWLVRMTQRNIIQMVHPIRNILFIRFLFGNIKEFLNYSYKEINLDKREPKKTLFKKLDTIKEEEYKMRIINLKYQEPQLLRSEICKRLNNEFRYLYYYDKNWLESILPKQSHGLTNDWHQKDIDCYALVYDVIMNIIDNETYDRITVNLIENRINNRSLHKNIDKMPKTQALINKFKENIPEFHMRKIKIAIQKTKQKGLQIKPYKILREVHIPPNYRRDYIEYINSLIEDI